MSKSSPRLSARLRLRSDLVAANEARLARLTFRPAYARFINRGAARGASGFRISPMLVPVSR